VCDGESWHFKANQGILHGSGQVVGSVAWYIIWESAEPDKDGQEESLPVGSKDNTLDRQEFGHGTEWLQIGVHTDPKHGQSIETDGNADIVYYATPKIARGETNVAFLKAPSSLHDDCGKGQHWLDPGVLEDASFDCQEGVWIGYVDRRQEIVERPEMAYRASSVHHDEESALPTDEINEELHERVDGEGLTNKLFRKQGI